MWTLWLSWKNNFFQICYNWKKALRIVLECGIISKGAATEHPTCFLDYYIGPSNRIEQAPDWKLSPIDFITLKTLKLFSIDFMSENTSLDNISRETLFLLELCVKPGAEAYAESTGYQGKLSWTWISWNSHGERTETGGTSHDSWSCESGRFPSLISFSSFTFLGAPCRI